MIVAFQRMNYFWLPYSSPVHQMMLSMLPELLLCLETTKWFNVTSFFSNLMQLLFIQERVRQGLWMMIILCVTILSVYFCYLVYFCYHLFCYLFLLISFIFVIIYISELGLFSLSLVDNNYADKTLVYKVVSYT